MSCLKVVGPTGTGIVGTQIYAKSGSSDEQVRGGLCVIEKGGFAMKDR